MGNKCFQNNDVVVLEEAGNISSYALVVIEQSLDYLDIFKDVFPEVRGYIFEWGLISEYKIDNKVVWNFHFLELQDNLKEIGITADDIVMVCLAYFDLDYWSGGESFWGGKPLIWTDQTSIWQRGGVRPQIQHCRHKIPWNIGFSHGSETDSLSIECFLNKELSARRWIGNVFLPKILDEMLQQVEDSLIHYREET